jgi:hypothetical protein
MRSRSTRTKHRVARYFAIQLQQASAQTFLIKPHQVTGRVAESRNQACAARRIWMRWLDHDSALGCCSIQCRIDALDPDVRQQAGFGRNLSTCSEGAADFSCRVIEARMSAVAVPNVPTKDFLVESNRLANVGRGNLEIAQPGARQQRQPALGLRNFGSPFVKTEIPRVLREKPVVAIQVFCPILPFAIAGLGEILHDLGAGPSRMNTVKLCVAQPSLAGLAPPVRALFSMIHALPRCI